MSPLGILVLGHQEAHPSIATALGLPAPAKGERLSVRLREVSKPRSTGQPG
ncbi:NaeI family type II restriction endonuclease [Cryobacterium sp. TMT2-23]|uniref:NaeI family type II restriction endonuclease n=1 Tax=Cryobacterium sp. TMT2-23 TaxID=1259252 RepID=UPI003510E9E8